MATVLLISLVVAAACVFCAWYFNTDPQAPAQCPTEPPLLQSCIPYIGHILGILQHGTRYFEITSRKIDSPIYSLNMLNGRVYVVTSPELVNAVYRNSKTLAFNPFIAQVGKRITGHDNATSQIVQHNLNKENGPGYVTEIHDRTYPCLSEPKIIEGITSTMLQDVLTSFHDLELPDSIDLFAYIRQLVTTSTTTAIYGPENPLTQGHQRLDRAFWDFDADLNRLMVDVFPNVLAPKANRARSRIGAAFQTYFERYTPGHTKSSVFTLKRYSINTEYGITPWNAARLEVGVLLGILANIIPAIFYMIVHIFSNKELLQQIREELLASSSIASSSSDDHRTRTLKILTMRAKCNLLHATMKEVLRHHALGSSVRFVREDTLLDGTYLLKKGMVVQMPMSVLHSSRSAWGVDPSAFRPSRFLEDDGGGPTGGKRMRQGNNSAFRPFGGGPSMCPGRHLATLETMSFVAHMVLSFDMEPVDGIWEIPRPKQESMATNVFPPERDIRVRLWRRDSDGGSGRWAFDMS